MGRDERRHTLKNDVCIYEPLLATRVMHVALRGGREATLPVFRWQQKRMKQLQKHANNIKNYDLLNLLKSF